ncbi:MAG: glycosyltransferase [Bacteroidota bacterium]
MEKNKKVLYISYDGMTDPLGQSQVIPYLIGLSQKGYSFTILSCEKKDNFLKNKVVIQNLLYANNIAWQPVFYTKKPPILSTIYDYNRLKGRAEALHIELYFDIIHCRSYISSLIGIWMKKKYKVPFIFDMRGFWADERVDGGLWSLNNPVFKLIYQYFKKKEIKFLNQSAAIICLTNSAKNEMLTWDGLNFNEKKINVIPCCVDTELFDPHTVLTSQQEQIKQALKISDDDFIIGYLGSIGTWYLLDEMMQFFGALKKVVKNAKFLFVTQDSVLDITLKAQKYNIDANDVIITPADRSNVPVMISLFKYGLFFIKPSYSKMASSPTKQGEIMAMDIPVICNFGVGDTDAIIEKYKSGLVIKNNDFTNSIQLIAEGSGYKKNSIREGALNYFSLNSGVQKYSDVYKQICNATINE